MQLTRAQIKASLDILSDAPVSLQMEDRISNYVDWSPYWDGNDLGIDLLVAGRVRCDPSNRRGTSC